MNEHINQISYPMQKTALAIGGTSLSVAQWPWQDIAACLTAIYTTFLLCEWLWKKALRPFAERRGWLKRPMRRKEDRGSTE